MKKYLGALITGETDTHNYYDCYYVDSLQGQMSVPLDWLLLTSEL